MALKKRALLIGINHYPLFPHKDSLYGCLNDVMLMEETLQTRFGFQDSDIFRLHDCDINSPSAPTRDNIMSALNSMCTSDPQDVILVYYAGHGSRRPNESKINKYNETIVPCDSGRHPRENRDITDDELALIVSRLTKRTKHLVLIFDSCHSGHILRLPHEAKARFVEPDWNYVPPNYETLITEACFRRGSSGWMTKTGEYTLLAACTAEEVAFEYSINGESDRVQGAWTLALCEVLNQMTFADGLSCRSYRDIYERASFKVTKLFPYQHPQLEGNVRQNVFGIDVLPVDAYALITETYCDNVQLNIGSIHGVTKGSIYDIISSDGEENTICTATLSDIFSIKSHAIPTNDLSRSVWTKIYVGCRAREISHAYGKLRTTVTINDELSKLPSESVQIQLQYLSNFIKLSPFLVLKTEASECNGYAVTICYITQNASSSELQYIVYGPEGICELDIPLPLNTDGTILLRNKLESLAKYHKLLSLQNESLQFNALEGKIKMSLKLNHPIADWLDLNHNSYQEGQTPYICEGDHLGVTVTNNSSFSVYITVLDLAEDGSVGMLWPPYNGKELMCPGTNFSLDKSLSPVEVTSVVNTSETFKLFASTEPADLSLFVQDNFRGNFLNGPNITQSELSSLLYSGMFRKVINKIPTPDYWITVQCCFKLIRKGTLEWRVTQELRRSKFAQYDDKAAEQLLQYLIRAAEESGKPAVIDAFRRVLERELRLADIRVVLACYEAVHQLWLLDYTRAERVQFLQKDIARVGFSLLLKPLEDHQSFAQVAICHSNLGQIILPDEEYDSEPSKCPISEAKQALYHYEQAARIWSAEGISTDHGLAVRGVADCYEVLMIHSDDDEQTRSYRKMAIDTYKVSYNLLSKTSSIKEYLQCVNNFCELFVYDANKYPPSQKELEDVVYLIENAAQRVKETISDMDEDLADLCSHIAELVNQICRSDASLPWQELIVLLVEPIMKLDCPLSDSQAKLDCCVLLGITYGQRLAGKQKENLLKAYEYTKLAALTYLQRAHENDDNEDADQPVLQFSKCASNCATFLLDLFDGQFVDNSWYKVECDTTLRHLNESISMLEESGGSEMIYAVIIRRNQLQRLPADQLAYLLHDEKFQAYKLLMGLLRANIANQALQNCIRIETSSTFPYTFLMCNGPDKCVHKEDMMIHFEEAEKCFVNAKASEDEGSEDDLLRIKNVYSLAIFWRSHCKLSKVERIERSLESFSIALELIIQSWPYYNLEAQACMANRYAIEVRAEVINAALELLLINRNSILAKEMLFATLTVSKSSNLLPILEKNIRTLYLPFSSVYSMDWLQISSAKRIKLSPLSTLMKTVHKFIYSSEIVVEWWTVPGSYAACIAYDAGGNMKVIRMWNSAEEASLRQLTVEATTNNFLNTAELASLSEKLDIKHLLETLRAEYPNVTKLILIPHNYLHFCPIHLLPIVNDFRTNLASYFSDGVSYLPSAAFLTRRANPLPLKEHGKAMLFQADPNADLPFTKFEIQTIESALKNKKKKYQSYYEVVSGDFQKALSTEECSVLHIACHGFWNPEDAAESYLNFQDGPLRLKDIRNINLENCELAVLSACNSGLRETTFSLETDIFSGFGAQLLASGCRNVVLSLAPILDRSTANLMEKFYVNYLQMPVAKALRDAQNDLYEVKVKSDTNQPRLVQASWQSALKYQQTLLPFVHMGID